MILYEKVIMTNPIRYQSLIFTNRSTKHSTTLGSMGASELVKGHTLLPLLSLLVIYSNKLPLCLSSYSSGFFYPNILTDLNGVNLDNCLFTHLSPFFLVRLWTLQIQSCLAPFFALQQMPHTIWWQPVPNKCFMIVLTKY